MIKKIISGGQSGADIAGLDVTIKNRIPHARAIPRGRITEDSVLPEKYNLQEMSNLTLSSISSSVSVAILYDSTKRILMRL
ncbi:YpsA SLOG family protein [Desulfotalea psychrophila]|uniref:Uncharacterized protein n=1 Tax=Desulfotalea psychrophila (strain LSv54 / DSM 12343) TaxID=177439 RepID=Q6AKM3_DESPS|nr:putative molybdenum carrier protein [Desulfotalea psychrophila]CAG37102.1 hypothetical protein DP2373 [Desulfotalea psychrophila LSv54]